MIRFVLSGEPAERAVDIDLRLILADVDGRLHDLTGLRKKAPGIYSPDDYSAGKALGRALRRAGSAGVVYRSVRFDGGLCVGAFRPNVLGRAKAGAHIAMHWDGAAITHWYEKKAPHAL